MDHTTEIRRKIIVDSVRTEQRFLENKLIALEHLDEFRRETIGNKQIVEALPEDGVLVDFLFFTQPFSNVNVSTPPKSYYLAFILQKDSAVTVIKLGDVQLIHESIEQFRESVTSQQRTNVVPIDALPNHGVMRQICHNLWMQLFRPLIPALGTKKHIFINPDGRLNLISFNTLVDDSSHFLIEKYQIHILANTRDILLWNHAPQVKSNKAVLIGDPDYDANLPTSFLTDSNKVQLASKIATGFVVKDSVKFAPLPFTRVEVMKIDTLLRNNGFKTRLLLGCEARESNLKSVTSPRILHIATHGFFRPDSKTPQDTTDFRVGENGGTTSHGEKPLLRCGLALSGANRIPKNVIGENGKATAAELITMDLTATDLVVLSACLTGYGEEVVEHEAIYGLFRSFLLAGAKTVFASLWEVSDYETKSLMIEFYQNYLNGKNLSKSEALRQAQLSMIERLRKQHGFANPDLWGAFVSIGEP